MSRYFFALWPDPLIRKKIINYPLNPAPAGQLIPDKNLHMTVLFMGKLTINQLQKVISASMNLTLPGFTIQLNQCGYFSRSKVSWLGLNFVPDALILLHKTLFQCARKSRIPLENHPYIPHLTLARKSRPIKTQTSAPIDWVINHFVLIESRDTTHGVSYQIIKDFDLQSPHKKHFSCNSL